MFNPADSSKVPVENPRMEGLNFFSMSVKRDEAENTGERNGGGHVVWRHRCVAEGSLSSGAG